VIRESLPERVHSVSPERRMCPVGHQVRDRWALRCPTCGRLMPRRFARTCPNGHLVAGPTRVCPACGEVLDERLPLYAVAGAVLLVFLVLVLWAWSADVPTRLIAFVEEAYAIGRDWVLALPLFTA